MFVKTNDIKDIFTGHQSALSIKYPIIIYNQCQINTELLVHCNVQLKSGKHSTC